MLIDKVISERWRQLKMVRPPRVVTCIFETA
jgi:hypothetical protein